MYSMLAEKDLIIKELKQYFADTQGTSFVYHPHKVIFPI
jgi:hypothetical protein